MNILNRPKEKSTVSQSGFQFIKKLFSFAKTKANFKEPDSHTDKAYLKLFYQSNAIMLLIDPMESGNHKIIDANDAAVEFYGYPREKLLQLQMGEIVTIDATERQKLMKEALKKSSNTLYFKHKLANNEIKDVKVFASPINLEGKKRMFLIVQDISEEIKAIQEIKKQQDYSQMLFNKSPDGLFIIDIEGNIIDGNSKAEFLIGAKKKDLIGVNIFKTNFLSDSDKSRFEKRIKKILQGAPTQPMEFTLNRQDGSKIIIEGQVEFIKYKGTNYFLGTMRDITARKQQELKLIESEAKFKYLADFTFDWEYWISPDGRYNYISPSCEKTTGYRAKEFEQHPDFLVKISTERYKDTVYQHFIKEAKDHTPHRMEFQIMNSKKELVWIEHSCRPIFDDEGKFLGKRGVNRDITKEKKALHSVEESNERFKKLSQLSFEGIMIQKQGVIQDVNQAFENLSGYKRDELIGQTVDMLLSNPKMKISVNKNINKSHAKPYETIFTKKDSKEIFVELEGKDFIIDNEKFRVAAIRDITQRKKQEMRRSVISAITKAVIQEIDFEALLQLIHAEISKLMDTSNYLFALYNQSTGIISAPHFSDDFVDISPFKAEGSLTGYLIKHKKSLLINQKEFIELAKAENIVRIGEPSLIWLGVPLMMNNVGIGAFVIQSYTDENAYSEKDQETLEVIASQISIAFERKQKEEELRKALIKAQESDRLKSTFLATMSHELRTPLNAIIGFSELAEAELPVEEIVDYCQVINKSGNHLLGIVNEIFDFTLIETGELKLSYDEYSISTILNDSYQIIEKEQLKLNKKNITLTYHIPEEYKNLKIKTDSQRLQQVLLNLLKNALKFTDKGSITYGFNIIVEDKSHKIQFYVKDTGIGIAKEKQEIIFDVFRQAEDSHTRKHHGVGLGLSISRKIISLLAGEIRLESTLGKGTDIYFNLPYQLDAENKLAFENSLDVPVKQEYNKKTILIADDDPVNYSLLELMLNPVGAKLIWAKDGEDAVELFNNNPDTNLILMDIRMPKLNGLEATKIIRKSNQSIPIIAQTAYAISGDKEIALESGCTDYIAKPIRKPLLLELISKYLS